MMIQKWRIHVKTVFLAGVVLTCYLQSAIAEDEYAKIEYKATPLSSSIYMLEGAGGNITASIGADGVFLVDDDFAPMAGKLLTTLKDLGGTTPKYIVNTHFHYDHTGGNEVFGSTATIIASPEVRERLMHEQTLWKEQHPAVPKKALPALTLEDSLTLHFNSEDIRAVHMKHGHTDGDTVVFFTKDKVASLGDLYFSGMYPIFHPEHKGSLQGLLKNLESIFNQITPDTKIVAGHGPISDKAELGRYIRMIKASIATVSTGIAQGNTLEQIQQKGLAPEWDTYSHGYLSTNRWIALIYEALIKK